MRLRRFYPAVILVAYYVLCAVMGLSVTWYQGVSAFALGLWWVDLESVLVKVRLPLLTLGVPVIALRLFLLPIGHCCAWLGTVAWCLYVLGICVLFFMYVGSVRLSNPFTRFVGGFYLELYIVHGVVISLFRHAPCVIKDRCLFAILVVLCSFAAAILLRPVFKWIKGIGRRALLSRRGGTGASARQDRPVYVLVATFFPKPDSWRCTYGYDYARAIQRTGKYRVVVFMPDYEGEYEYHGIRVYGFKSEHVTDSGALYYLKCRQNQRHFLERFDQVGINADDVAVCEAYNGDLGYYGWGLQKRNPQIVTALHHHSLGSFGIMFGSHRYFWPIKVLNFLWMRYVHEHQDVHVCISKKCEASLRAFPDASWSIYEPYREIGKGLGLLHPARIKRAYVLHNGVDCRVFTPDNRTPSKVFRLGCIANCQKLKGHITLLRALDRIKDRLGAWTLRLVGSGETKRELEEFVHEHGLEQNVQFLKEVEHEQLADFYRDLDLFVLPSFFEGFGCVYTEAWACGTPFIACRGFGMDDLIEHPECSPWLITPNDDGELAAKILHYYMNRPVQRLTGPVDIDTLVPRYLGWLERMFN